MIRILATVLLALSFSIASAWAQCPTQSTPGFTGGGNVFGRSPDQLNQYFGVKVDANGGCLDAATLEANFGTFGNLSITGLLTFPDGSTWGASGLVPVGTPIPYSAISNPNPPVTVITATGLISCTAAITVWKPVTPAASSCSLPTSPTDGQLSEIIDQMGGNISIPLTIMTGAAIITPAGNSVSSVNLTRIGEVVTMRYSATLTSWVVD
jgi:hypothetical protein